VNGRKALLAIAAFAMIAAAIIYFLTQELKPDTGVDKARLGAVASTSVSRSDVGGAKNQAAPKISLRRLPDTTSFSRPLPAPGRPLIEIYKELDALVKEGDARAACRLGFEIDRCAKLPATRQSPAFWQSEAARHAPGSAQYKSAQWLLERTRAATASAEAACAGFAVSDGSVAWDYTLAAALAGNRQAIWNAVGFPAGLDLGHPENTLEGWTQWRQYAPGLISAGIEAGDPRVFSIAARDYEMPRFGAQLFERDPVRSVALLMAILPSAAPAYRPTMERDIAYAIRSRNLSPQDQEAARALATTLPRVRIASGDGFDWSRGMAPETTGRECEEP
jgi:hypothetical protein